VGQSPVFAGGGRSADGAHKNIDAHPRRAQRWSCWAIGTFSSDSPCAPAVA
jgi:hypothetical protein